ncbi:unnamed protein product [Brugia timori]|uniref:Methyltransferase n=1 Tax=Brugia timori TaxID=42155 RepID=A0A0R3QAF9_9BILA|nr:unnamed protein product [Brugia timori]
MRVFSLALSPELSDYISAHHYLFEGCTVLELGAGCTGIPGLVAAKCGAKLVIFTDHPESEEAFKILKQNCVVNNLDENCFLIKKMINAIELFHLLAGHTTFSLSMFK